MGPRRVKRMVIKRSASAGNSGNSTFKYRGKGRTTESVRRKAKQSSGMYDSYINSEAQMYKAKEGECNVRILPPTWDTKGKYGDGWEVGIWVHYSVGPDNGAYLCVEKMNEEPCAICEARRNSTDPEEADALKPGWRGLCWIIDRDDQKAGPQMWSMPAKLFREINTRSVDKKSGAVILIDDPEEGYDVGFTREGTQLKTNYTGVEVSRDPSPLHDDPKKAERWLKYIEDHPVPEMLNFFDAEHIEGVLFGRTSGKGKEEEGEEEEEEDNDRRVRAKPSARRAKAAAEEEEEEEENDPVPEEAPRSRRAAKPRDEEEEEEETEEETEEEEDDDDEEEEADEEDDAPRPAKAARTQLRKLRRLSR
jgi:hypothetical protein